MLLENCYKLLQKKKTIIVTIRVHNFIMGVSLGWTVQSVNLCNTDFQMIIQIRKVSIK